MSENERIVRAFFEAFNADDIETALTIFDDTVVLEMSGLPEQEETQPFWGHDGARELWRLNREPFGEVIVEILDVIEKGDDVVVLTHNHARGRASGIAVMQPRGAVVTVLGGKIVRARFYTDHARAIEEAGLGSDAT